MIFGVAAATLLTAFFAQEHHRALKKQIRVHPLGLELELTPEEMDDCWEVFHDAGISEFFYEEIVGIVVVDDVIVGVLCGVEELSIAIHPDHQGMGYGTVLLAAFLEVGGTGFMVAGTEKGSSFLHEFPSKLGGFPEELDVPSWGSLAEQWGELE